MYVRKLLLLLFCAQKQNIDRFVSPPFISVANGKDTDFGAAAAAAASVSKKALIT